MTPIKTKAIHLDIKSLSDTGTFEGYGSVFDVVDYGKDSVDKGAFSKSLEAYKASGRAVPVLWQHKTDNPIGHWTELSEDNYGLLGKADLWLDDVPDAKRAYKGMKTKSITGLSIGYKIRNETYDKKTGITRLHELDLVEISVVTNPMMDLARTTTVKSFENLFLNEELPTLKQFEEFLREAGASHSQAKAIAGNGLTKLLANREDGSDTANLLDALKGFKL